MTHILSEYLLAQLPHQGFGKIISPHNVVDETAQFLAIQNVLD